jgi:hypothetical protein
MLYSLWSISTLQFSIVMAVDKLSKHDLTTTYFNEFILATIGVNISVSTQLTVNYEPL